MRGKSFKRFSLSRPNAPNTAPLAGMAFPAVAVFPLEPPASVFHLGGTMARVWKLSLSSLPLIAALLSGCGKPSTGPAATDNREQFPLPTPPLVVEDIEPGTRGGRLVIATFGDPKTFNPITANEQSSRDIYRFLFAALLSFDEAKQEVSPGLAESWTVGEDQKTFTFKLRQGLRWSDGAPLTADDVVFSWQAIYDTNVVCALADLLKIRGEKFQVSKVDDLTIRITTPDVFAPFLEFAGAGVYIIPKHKLEASLKSGTFESALGINTTPADIVCSGPFRMKQFKAGELTLMERNPYYFAVDKAGTRLPYLDTVIYTVVPDMNAMSLRFRQGESDAFENVRPDEYDTYKAEAAAGKYQLLDLGQGLERAFVWFNLNTGTNPSTGKPYVNPKKLKWFSQKAFRQAVAHCIDRESIIKSIYAGRAEPNYGYIGKANGKWLNPNLKEYPFNLQKARTLLAGIGIQDRNGNGVLEDAEGNEIEFTLNTNTGNNTRDKIALLIQSDLKKLGFKVNYRPVEFNALIDKIDVSYDYECVLLSLGGGAVEPASSMNILLSSGFTHLWFPKQKTPATPWEARLDELMNLQVTTLDFAKRKQYFDEVQTILNDELPMIYTVAPNTYAAIRNGMGNLKPTVLSSYRVTWNVEQLFIRK
jgi:peptide/nickel transport system substrate-binding protein